MKARSAVLVGSVLSSVLASACCVGPVAFVLLGFSGAACEMPSASRTAKALLWLSAVAVMVVTAFPWYSIYLF